MTKNPWLVFRLKHKISKQNFLEFFFMEKMLIIQLHSGFSHEKKNSWLVFQLKHKISKQKFLELSFMEKMLVIQLHSGFSHDKKSLVSVSVETRNFETKIFRIFIHGKNAHRTIALWVFS